MSEVDGQPSSAPDDPDPDQSRPPEVDAVQAGAEAYRQWRTSTDEARAGTRAELLDVLLRVGRSYARAQLARRTLMQDDAVDEVMNEAARRMIPKFEFGLADLDRLENLRGFPVTYFFKIIERLVLDRRREILHRKRKLVSLGHAGEGRTIPEPIAPLQVSDEDEDRMDPELITLALERMKSSTRADCAYAVLVEEHHVHGISLVALARKYGVENSHALEQRAFRARRRVREFVLMLKAERGGP